MKFENIRIVIRGGGDIASAVVQKLYNVGFSLLICEVEFPTMIRRSVSYGSAVFDGSIVVEGIKSERIDSLDDIQKCIDNGVIPVTTVKENLVMDFWKPSIFIDGTISKKPTDYKLGHAPLVIGFGPEIEAGCDADIVIETNRGHDLGRLIYEGKATPSTGIPGNIEGFTSERVLRAPIKGQVSNQCALGDLVLKGGILMLVDDQPVYATMDGKVRGLIQNGAKVFKNMKIGDIDPRGHGANHLTISDKGRNIAGGVLEAVLVGLTKKDLWE